MTDLYTREGSKHEGKHATNDKGKPYFVTVDPCHRCGGRGGADHWRFTGWTCYRCGGTREERPREVRLYTQEELTKLNAIADKKYQKKRAVLIAAQEKAAAEAAARRAEFEAANAELFASVREWLTGQEFIMGVFNQCLDRALISDKQREMFESNIAEAKRKAASPHIGTIGERRSFTGEITVAYYMPSTIHGWAGRTIYCVRTAEGTVKYTGSASLGAKGDVITFTATIDGHEEYRGEKQTIVSRPKLQQQPERHGQEAC